MNKYRISDSRQTALLADMEEIEAKTGVAAILKYMEITKEEIGNRKIRMSADIACRFVLKNLTNYRQTGYDIFKANPTGE